MNTNDAASGVDLQMLAGRIELLERQSHGWRALAAAAMLVALVALALPALRGTASGEHVRASVVEANRILLRDLGGGVAGGLESTPDGTLRLVLGARGTASAQLVVPRGGAAQLTLRAPDGGVRAVLDGGDAPAAWLSRDGRTAHASLAAPAGGEVWLRDAVGRPRFHAP